MLLLLFPALIFAQSSADTKLPSKTKCNNDWKFVLDDKAGFETVDFDDAARRTLNLPHDWGVEGKKESLVLKSRYRTWGISALWYRLVPQNVCTS